MRVRVSQREWEWTRERRKRKIHNTQTHINCFVARCHPITHVQCMCCAYGNVYVVHTHTHAHSHAQCTFFWAGVAISQSNQKLNFTIMTHLKWFEVENMRHGRVWEWERTSIPQSVRIKQLKFHQFSNDENSFQEIDDASTNG